MRDRVGDQEKGILRGMASYTSPLAQGLSSDVLDRFTRYVRIDTQSRRDRESSPSTPGQLELGRLLTDELSAVGLDDAELDDNGYVMATLPASGSSNGAGPVIGLIAHMDTSPDAPGRGVEPIVHRAYDGGVIELPLAGTRLDPETMPELGKSAGHDIVTASGDTLLAGTSAPFTVAPGAAARFVVTGSGTQTAGNPNQLTITAYDANGNVATGYAGDHAPTMSLGHATSRDGIHWNRDPAYPIFNGSWVEDMCVVKQNGTYSMFAEGQNDIAHLLTSADGLAALGRSGMAARGGTGNAPVRELKVSPPIGP